MKILHVTLGNPRTHQGGLNRYCLELAEEEIKQGHKVKILYPGSFVTSKYPFIKKIDELSFIIYDSLPVALTLGVDFPERYMVKARNNNYYKFLKKNQFDIIHIHSIQGIHKELFLAAKSLNIPMVFTTHDYYPICFKCTLVRKNEICEGSKNANCTECNLGCGISANKQRILQLKMYQVIKKFSWVNKIRNREILNNKNQQDSKIIEKIEYIHLKKYYKEILEMITTIHANSIVAAKMYKKNIPTLKEIQLIQITHSGLYRKKHVRKSLKNLNIAYMGGMSTHKGYEVFVSAFKILSLENPMWRAFFYGSDYSAEVNKLPNANYYGYFESEHVWENIDLVVVPSMWRETFGFVVLEALCQGIPVVCSNLVGSSFLLKDIDRELVYEYDCINKLVNILKKFENIEYYNKITCLIDNANINCSMKEHTKELILLYRKCGKNNKYDFDI